MDGPGPAARRSANGDGATPADQVHRLLGLKVWTSEGFRRVEVSGFGNQGLSWFRA